MIYRKFSLFILILFLFLFTACFDSFKNDTDKDGIPDAEDNCIEIANPEQEDSDSDYIGDVCDNCMYANNPKQEDSNGDGIGDACPCPMEPSGPLYFGIERVLFNDNYFSLSTHVIFTKCENSPWEISGLKTPKFGSMSLDMGEYNPDLFYGMYGGIPIDGGEITYITVDGKEITENIGGVVKATIGAMTAYFPTSVIDGDITELMGLPDISPNRIAFMHTSNVDFMGLYITDLSSLMNMLPVLIDILENFEFTDDSPLAILGYLLKPMVKILGNENVIIMFDKLINTALGQGFINIVDMLLPPIMVIMPVDMMMNYLPAEEEPEDPVDTDSDGVEDSNDNCKYIANPGQEDCDNDNRGDVCEDDIDNDSIPDDCDNCDLISNSNQKDSDNDKIGDACDNCPNTPNPSQQNSDGDLLGNACDNCPLTVNPDQEDIDSDGIGDVCDPCVDLDNDGVCEAADNCPGIPNANQSDTDCDGYGDACDVPDLTDADCDGIVDNCEDSIDLTDSDCDGIPDNCRIPSHDDLDCDGVVDGCDSSIDFYDIDCNNISDNCQPPDLTDADCDDIIDGCDNYINLSDINGNGIADACETDLDDDGILDADDNCPQNSNPGQEDTDCDGAGDACDSPDITDADCDGIPDGCDSLVDKTDKDCDGVIDGCDNNIDLTDLDCDNIPDTCKPPVMIDIDCDKIPDGCDSNINSNDSDCDGISDACKNPVTTDVDCDGIFDGCDENIKNTDSDCDGISDACQPPDKTDLDCDKKVDACDDYVDLTDSNNNGTPDACESDTDGDGILDYDDNCPQNANPGQEDTDCDGAGDACDNPDTTDADCNSIVDGCDNDIMLTDSDCDGRTDACQAPDTTDIDCDNIYDGCDQNIQNTDSDCDGITDACKQPVISDADCDGINDGCDAFINREDKDCNNIPDSCELPNLTDADCDGIVDTCEGSVDSTDLDCDGSYDGCDDYVDLTDNDCDSIPDSCQAPDLADADCDGMIDGCDNDVNLVDSDCDGISDACIFPIIADVDCDGINDGCDNNIDITDDDADGISNTCDICPFDPNNDYDDDGICGDIDNCPNTSNPGQEDNNNCNDNDGIGDICEEPCPDELTPPLNVMASDGISQEDPWSTEKGPIIPVDPSVPESMIIYLEYHKDQVQIDVTWDPVPGASYYKVYRCDEEDCTNGTYNLVSSDDSSLSNTSWSDEFTGIYKNGNDGPPYYSNAWHTNIKNGIEWGRISDVQPTGVNLDEEHPAYDPIYKPRTYTYKVKAFNSSGLESEFSLPDEGNRLPSHPEFFNWIVRPEGKIFFHRLYCCNNDPYLNDILNFEGDLQGNSEFTVEGGTNPVKTHQKFYNYQNALLIYNGQVDGVMDTNGTGWQTGTVIYSGIYKAELDYGLYFLNKSPASGPYTLRYESIEHPYFHEPALQPKPTQNDCNSMGIPFNASYKTSDCL